MFYHDWSCVEVVHWNVEESLNLSCVQIHSDHAVDTGCRDQVRYKLGRDRHPRFIFAVLTSVAKEWHDSGDAASASAACSIYHDEKLHQVVVRRWAGWLHDEDVFASNVFVDLNESLTIWESIDSDIGNGGFKVGGNVLCELIVS